jgi:hypothetical protein
MEIVLRPLFKLGTTPGAAKVIWFTIVITDIITVAGVHWHFTDRIFVHRKNFPGGIVKSRQHTGKENTLLVCWWLL